MIQNNDFTPMTEIEIDLVAGGPWYVVAGAVVAVGAAVVAAGTGLITIGEKIHDAVCDH